MLFLFATIDVTKLFDLVKEFLGYFLVTIPGNFISQTLDSGILRTIWVSFFGNSDVIQLFFILALFGGFFWYFSNPDYIFNKQSKM